jgi:hypothetical protein
MASVILGDWTHRRGDAGGARAVSAEIQRPRPVVAWVWQPEHGGRVDQVRVVGTTVVVATMMPRDPNAPRWEHAVVYVLDANTGVEVARRVLPDPVPVAAMVVEDGVVHVVSTLKGEPVFWYALTPGELVPLHRRIVSISDGLRHDDVLDAWATPDGGLWLELDTTSDGDSIRVPAYIFADQSGAPASSRVRADRETAEGPPFAHDACAGGHELFAPLDGHWGGGNDASPPAILRLDRGSGAPGARGTERAGEAWARASVVGPRSRIHTLFGDGAVCAVAVAEDPAKPDLARLEAFAVDRTSGVVRWRAHDDRLATKPKLGDAARVARRPNGELLFQSLGTDGEPCSPLICAGADGRVDSILLGARGRYVLDAALGDLVLAHRENKEHRVEVSGFAIDQEGRLLGRRAVPQWTIDLGDLGGEPSVYAGAGAVIVRGATSVCAVRL